MPVKIKAQTAVRLPLGTKSSSPNLLPNAVVVHSTSTDIPIIRISLVIISFTSTRSIKTPPTHASHIAQLTWVITLLYLRPVEVLQRRILRQQRSREGESTCSSGRIHSNHQRLWNGLKSTLSILGVMLLLCHHLIAA